MVKKFLLISVLLISLEEAKGQLIYGVKAGANINTINTYLDGAPSWVDFDDNVESSVGFHAGLFLVVDLSKKFSFRPEIEYIQKGVRDSGYPSVNIPSYKITVSYIQVPVIFSYKIFNKLCVEAGPGFGYLISSKSDSDLTTFPAETYTVKLEVSVLGGFRYTLFQKIDVIARYSLGLSNIQDSMYYAQNPETSEIIGFESVAKNGVLSFSIAYSFK